MTYHYLSLSFLLSLSEEFGLRSSQPLLTFGGGKELCKRDLEKTENREVSSQQRPSGQ